MIPTQTFDSYPEFGDSSTKTAPDDAKYSAGFQQSDVLPAEWMNWAWAHNTKGITDLNTGLSSTEAELNAVVEAGGQTASESTSNQVLTAINYLITAVTGSLSSLATSVKTSIVAAINSHVNDTDNPHSVTAKQVGLGNVTNVATTSSVTSGSANNVTSGAVYTALKSYQPILSTNNTWFSVGDDCYIGDHNVGGNFCIKAKNSNFTPGITFYDSDDNKVSTALKTTDVTSSVTSGSTAPITSGGVYSVLSSYALSSTVETLSTEVDNIATATTLASGTSDSSIVAVSLGDISAYRFLLIEANYDGYTDTKLVPVSTLITLSLIGGKGYHLLCKKSSSYYWEGNIGFYTGTTTDVEIYTIAHAGWYAVITIYGIA